jgi:hypothetical protein
MDKSFNTACRFAAVLLCILLPGCGGSGNGLMPTSKLSTLSSPPALPAPDYSGNTAAASLTTNSAGQISERVFDAITFANSATGAFGEGPFAGFGNGKVNKTLQGGLGGNVVVQGDLSDSNSEWLVETFNQYAYKINSNGQSVRYVVNGTVILEGNQKKLIDTYGYKNFTERSPEFNVTYNGALSSSQSSGVNLVTLNLGIHDNTNNNALEFSNFSMQVQLDNPINKPGYPTSVNGRIYEQDIGYVDLSGDSPSNYVLSSDSLYYPLSGGDLAITGADGDVLRVEPLSARQFSAVVQSGSGASQVVQAARFDWATFKPDISSTSAAGPVADMVLSADTQTDVGTPVTVDGGFSHSPDGTFLTFNWKMKFAPPGSTAVMNQTNEPEAVFTPDVAGDYMLELTVNNGTSTATNDMVVTVGGGNGLGLSAAGSNDVEIEPVPRRNVGTPVQLYTFTRLGDMQNEIGSNVTYTWSLTDPPGSSAALSDPGSATPTFTPDIPGSYIVSLMVDANNTAGSTQSKTIYVGGDLSYDPPIQPIFDSYFNYDDSLVVTDINGDHLPDIIFAETKNYPSTPLYVLMNEGNGKFATPSVITLSDRPESVAVGDLNGDSRPDIAVAFQYSVDVYLQGSDGSFGSPVTLSYPSGCPKTLPELLIVRLFGASTHSLVMLGCDDLTTWDYSGGGFTGPSSIVPVTGTGDGVGTDLLADATGDGISDAVGMGTYNYVSGILVAPGLVGGGFDTPQFFDSIYGFPVVGDINDDGNPDLIAQVQSAASPSGPSLDIFYGTGSGLGTTPVNYPVSVSPAGQMVIADLNGDGLADLIEPGSGGLDILEQQSDHTLGSQIFFSMRGDFPSGDLWIADMNGDGIPDIVAFNGENLAIYYGNKD